MPVHSYPLEIYLQCGESTLQIVGPYGYGKQEWYITNLLVYDSFLTGK